MTRKSRLGRPTAVARLLAVLMLGCASSGCATLWTVLEVTNSDWSQGRFTDHVEPIGPIEERVSVTGAYVPPDAQPTSPPPQDVVVEPQPGVVEVHPYAQVPVPMRPLPQGGVALRCSVERRASLEKRYETLYRYDAVWRVLAGFMVLSEGTLAGLLTWSSTRDTIDPGPLVVGLYFAADALGTLVLAFHPKQELRRESTGPGEWKRENASCPEGLGVEVETGTFRVEPDGHVWNLEPWMLQHLVETTTAELHLTRGPQRATYAPSLQERCAWSDLAQSPAPFCGGVQRSGAIQQGSATFDLTPR